MGIEEKLKIRKAELKDAEALVALTSELGYQITKEEIQNKLERITSRDDQQIYVAEIDSVVGWIHFSFVEPLESPSFVEIRGIVVNEQHRGKGIGTKLIDTAAEWAVTRGSKKLRVRTNLLRTETREYYRKTGFVSVKNQEVFEKIVSEFF